jgi:HEAT repeat protein
MRPHVLLVLALAWLPAVVVAGPLSREEAERQSRVLAQLKTSLAEAAEDADKLAVIADVMSAERDANFRRRVLEIAAPIPGPAREAFLMSLLTTDEDAGLRSQAATLLGQVGSEECVSRRW